MHKSNFVFYKFCVLYDFFKFLTLLITCSKSIWYYKLIVIMKNVFVHVKMYDEFL